MKVLLWLAIPGLTLSSCATPSKFEQLSASDKTRLEKSMSEVEQLSSCAEESKGNDAAFTSRCSKILSGKKLYAKFRQVNAFGSRYKVQADISGETFIVCQTTPNKETTEKLAALKPMDDILLSGQVSRYIKTERKRPKTIYESKVEKFGHQVDLDPCTVNF